MRFILTVLAAGFAVACAIMPDRAFSATVEPTGEQIDSAPCTAALTAADDDKIIAFCGALIGNDKAPKADRVKAAIARASAYDRKGEDGMARLAAAEENFALGQTGDARMFAMRARQQLSKSTPESSGLPLSQAAGVPCGSSAW